MYALDLFLFNAINGFAGHWLTLDFIGIFFAKYFEYVLLFCLLLFLLKDFKKYWRMVAQALVVAVFVRFVMVEIIRRAYFRPRPFVFNDVHLLIPYSANEPSFPSSHASFYFALSTIIYSYNKKVGILFYIGSALICLGRVFVGIHWPSDIFTGAILGIIMGFVLTKLFNWVNFSQKAAA